MKNEIIEKLNQLALDRSIPFCYSCYKDAPTGKCTSCGSDDLMRHLPSVGCEYGTEWIVDRILETELTPIDTEELFEEFVRQCYPETTQLGWMNVDTIEAMKSQDPTSWRIALDEWISSEEESENIISFDNDSIYYKISDFESYLK